MPADPRRYARPSPPPPGVHILVNNYRNLVLFLCLASSLALSACESLPEPSSSPSGVVIHPPPASPSQPPLAFESSGNPEFDTWRLDFARRAEAEGRKRETVLSVLGGLTPLEQMVQTAAFEQAEFVKPVWDYAKSAASPTRISNGRKKLDENLGLFERIEQTYAAPREIVTAIWGMETSYGGYIGDFDAPRALATQAAMGRRKAFNEGELLAIMKLIEAGAATREQFRKGSWAGAVGQTQFMPSTFLAHGQDFDRDGRKDLWSNPGDALASAAHYLSVSGWRRGEPWAVETVLPENFDYSLGDGVKRPVSTWIELGLAPAAATEFAPSADLKAELFLPAGSYGPAFLLFDNFSVIKRYNNADSYALAVGLLADRLAGRADLVRPWPTDLRLLTSAQAKELQAALTRLGYSPGPVDGVIGRNTRKALQAFQKDRQLVADGFPTAEMLETVLIAANG